MSNDDFTVTLLEDPKVEGTLFPRHGEKGLAKSIVAVPDVGKTCFYAYFYCKNTYSW